MEPTKKSLFEYLYENVTDDGGRILFFTEKEQYSVRDVYGRISSLASFLGENGIGSGDMVALSCPRLVDTALLFFTLQSMGVVTILCDPHTCAEDFVKATGNELPVKAFVNYNNERWSLSVNESRLHFCVGALNNSGQYRFPATDVKAPALIIFTSGSTGKSKGVVLSQYNYLNYVVNYRPNGNYSHDDISPEVLPLHHVFGLAVILTGLINRYQVFFPKIIRPDYIAACIEKYRLTRLDGVPSFAYALADTVVAKGYDTSSLRVGVLGGAPSSRTHFDYIQNTLGLKLVPAYGQSECLVISGVSAEASDDDRATSVGKFLEMSRGYILDRDGNELSVGQEGEICVSAPEVMLGYYNDPEETAKAIDPQGRLHTGDLGYVDERGFLHITGRIKDIIIRNGNNLSVLSIEKKLSTLPFIAQAAVVGIKDEVCGEVPAALIVLKDEQLYDEDAVKAVLVKNEVPQCIQFVSSIPLTSSGKPDKQRIKALFEEGYFHG